MIYRAIKRIYPITTIMSLIALFIFTSVSDFHTMEMHDGTPTFAYIIMVVGIVLMIPAGLYVILDYIKDKYIDREE